MKKIGLALFKDTVKPLVDATPDNVKLALT